MKKQLISLAFIAISAFSGEAIAQLSLPAPSPKQTLTQQFATSKIEVIYSRPSVKGRKVFGDLVPYGKMWRTGANASSQIYFAEAVTINGNAVPAGRYSLFTIPNEKEWEIIINKDSALSGTNGYNQERDVVRFKVKPGKVNDLVETFTIDIANITAKTCDIVLKWEKTSIVLNVVANYHETVMKQIDKLMTADSRPYYDAARYYYENDGDSKKALEWINKAAEANPNAFWILHLKAKIQLKNGDKAGAIATAEQSKEKAKAANNDEYVKMNDELIAQAKK